MPDASTLYANSIHLWKDRIEKAVRDELIRTGCQDGSHDFGHFLRVSSLAVRFATEECADTLVAYTAGMLHDIVSLPKNAPNAKQSSKLAADRAKEILLTLEFPSNLIANVCHAIHAHSFSANVTPETIEAKCVQDADRMESLGAFGMTRTFYVSGQLQRKIMDEKDPSAKNRELNDKQYALDHFLVKLFTLEKTMKTEIGRKTAHNLTTFLEDFYFSILKDAEEGNLVSGRFRITEVYYEAGKNKLALFHPDDPFAENGRRLERDKYALDNLLGSDDEYVTKFLEQHKFELNGYTHISH